MIRRGFERLVGVVQKDQLVAVYIPGGKISTRYLEASVLVIDRRQLVCVSATADAESLMELATMHIPASSSGESFLARAE